jgi:hypothetical protein
MSAKEFLAEKGVFNLDTKKRYNEVIAWMEEYAALRRPHVVGRSEQFICPDCKKHTEEWLDGICEDCTLKGFTEGK